MLRSAAEALEFTNTLVESVCSDVEAICSLSIQCLKSPHGMNHVTDVCRALSVIQERLSDLKEHIKSTSKDVNLEGPRAGGGQHFNPSQNRLQNND
ncbi:MAG: hypothetical protein Q4B17_14610 [Lautropia sp.]|nr:hypothetical protein [Lautropia sp.]